MNKKDKTSSMRNFPCSQQKSSELSTMIISVASPAWAAPVGQAPFYLASLLLLPVSSGIFNSSEVTLCYTFAA